MIEGLRFGCGFFQPLDQDFSDQIIKSNKDKDMRGLLSLFKLLLAISIGLPHYGYAQDKEVIHKSHAFVQQVAKEFSAVKTVEDFVRLAMTTYGSEDLEYAFYKVKQSRFKKLPKVTGNGHTVTISHQGTDVSLDVYNGRVHKFRLDGYEFQRKFGKNLRDDYAYIERILTREKSAGLLDLALPSAHALLPLAPLVILGIVGVGGLAIAAFDWSDSAQDAANIVSKQMRDAGIERLNVQCGGEDKDYVVKHQTLVNHVGAMASSCTIVESDLKFRMMLGAGASLNRCQRLSDFKGTEKFDIEHYKPKEKNLTDKDLESKKDFYASICHCCLKEGCAEKLNSDNKLLTSTSGLSCRERPAYQGSATK